MKKRAVSLILSIAMIIGMVPLYAYAAPFSNKSNVEVIFEAPKEGTALPEGSFEATEGLVTSVREENGERFIVIDGNSIEAIEASGTTVKPYIKLDASMMQGNDYTGINGFKLERGEKLENKWIVYHVKFNDKGAYDMFPASWNMYLTTTKDQNLARYGYGAIGSKPMRWLDAEDGALRDAYPNSGRIWSNNVTGWEFFGDTEGYLCFPISMAKNLQDISYFADRYTGIKLELYAGTAPLDNGNHKPNSWSNRELLIGDVMIVDDLEKLQEELIEKNNITKFAPNKAEDTAYVAYKLPNYESSYVNWCGSAGKKGDDPTASVSSDTRGHLHRTSLPNGDPAYIINLAKGQKSGKGMAAQYGNTGTYETRNTGVELRTPVPGIPEDIDLPGIDYLAIRFALKAAKGATKEANFTFEFSTSAENSNHRINAGNYTFIGSNGKTSTITVKDDNSITLNGDVDGWILVPVDAIGEMFIDKDSTNDENGRPNSVLYETWGGNKVSGVRFRMNSGFDDGSRTAYIGDIYFVEDDDDFIEYHTTKCDAVGHKAVSYKEIPATCKKEGTTAGKKCSVCGEVLEGLQSIARPSHNMQLEEKIPPTATEMGYDLLKCSLCGEIWKRNYVDALGQVTSGISSDKEPNEQSDISSDTESQPSDNTQSEAESDLEIEEDENKPSVDDKNDFPIGLIILIAAIIFVAAGATVLVIVLIKKKKANKPSEEIKE